MSYLIRPLWSLVSGFVSSMLGLVMAVYRYPGTGVFNAVLNAMPEFGLVLVFITFIGLALVGLYWSVKGITELRQRYDELNTIYPPRNPRNY